LGVGWAFRHAAALGSSSSGGSCVLCCCSAVLVAALAAYKYKQRDKEGGGVSEHKCVFVKPAWLGQSEEGLGGGLTLQTYQCPQQQQQQQQQRLLLRTLLTARRRGESVGARVYANACVSVQVCACRDALVR
jgi:hypothetical protein